MDMEFFTTHVWKSFGLQVGVWHSTDCGEGVIVGVIDTGINQSHISFHDHNVPIPPDNWRGRSPYNSNKLIGLRVYRSPPQDNEPPEGDGDITGHGTHVASICGGNFVDNAQVWGQALGTSAGIAPRCHIAVYKLCAHYSHHMYDAFADACSDGVHVINCSLGWIEENIYSFWNDAVALGTLTAIQHNILTCSAGNAGPNGGISNCAPWILTVGASSIGRVFEATVCLGNEKEYRGQAVYQPDVSHKSFKIVDGVKAYVKGETAFDDKFVLLDSYEKVYETFINRAAGVIIMSEEKYGRYSTPGCELYFPSSQVCYEDGIEIRKYIENMESEAVVKIKYHGTTFDAVPTDVAPFSSRGPSRYYLNILKPDILAPGDGIVGSSHSSTDSFITMSGTSMAAPIVTGTAALVLKKHPGWSPAAVKSAIMTTANELNLNYVYLVNEERVESGPGIVNPKKACEPGLIFDISLADLEQNLVSIVGYTPLLRYFLRKEIQVNEEVDLNYPSFMCYLKAGSSQTFKRTLTNVSEPDSYTIQLNGEAPNGVEINVEPKKLVFSSVGEKISYTVRFSLGKIDETVKDVVGSMKWVSNSNKYTVRTPFQIVIVWNKVGD